MYGFWNNKRIVLYDTLLSPEMNEELKKILDEEKKDSSKDTSANDDDNTKEKDDESSKKLGMNDDEVVAVLAEFIYGFYAIDML